jgi:hypothetical protein
MTQLKTRKASRAKTAAVDPIFAAITEHKALAKESWHLCDKLGAAEEEAAKTFRRRPWSLIEWRKYSAIGEHEIDRAREEFLMQPGADPEQIEKEYQDAKRREAAAEYEGIAWDQLTGIAPLREQFERAQSAEDRAAARMARTKPTTTAGVSALITYIWNDVKDDLDSMNWSTPALKTAAVSLAQMNKEAA